MLKCKGAASLGHRDLGRALEAGRARRDQPRPRAPAQRPQHRAELEVLTQNTKFKLRTDA